MADPTKLDEVRDVLARNKSQIMSTYRAEGVGIGKEKPTDTSHVLVVYIASRGDLPKQPIAIEGVPLQFEVTGKFVGF
jgi:hypothetical protein